MGKSMRIKNLPLIIDNTVISNFGLINRFDILSSLHSNEVIIPTNVIIESIVIPSLEKHVQAALSNGWMQEYTLEYTSERNELKEYANLKKRFDDGESAAMAIAKTWGCTLASDDMKAVRKYCVSNKIELLGSLGILFDAYSEKLINAQDGQQLLSDMINMSRYKCPVSQFKEVIDWFEKGIGRELF